MTWWKTTTAVEPVPMPSPPAPLLGDLLSVLPQLAGELATMRREIERVQAEVLAVDIAIRRAMAAIGAMEKQLDDKPARAPQEFTYDVRSRDGGT